MLKKITLLSAILPVATALTEPCFGPALAPPAAVPPPVSVGTAGFRRGGGGAGSSSGV
ncbi:MAG: hypothetical protein IPN66_05825 [Candidatus Competibacteraceae bacterium]|nr:hypothetical protein [Candidatus Competibacteraceae bacterium]